MSRVLVLGCGSIGERHIRCLKRVGGAEVTAVDPRADRVQAMRDRYGVLPGPTEYESADLSDFDAVMICTPTDQHIPQAMRAARAGCHLFIEKPISTDMIGVDELIDLCLAKGLVLQVGYVYRHHPLMAETKRVLEAGDIGEVHLVGVKGGYAVERVRPDFRATYWVRKTSGGGVFYDATHQFDYIQHLVSPVTAVTAQVRHYEFDVDPDVEDTAVALLEFEGGQIGSVSLNHFQRNSTHRLELVGNRGTILWEIDEEQLVIFRDADRSWERKRLELERDDWYVPQTASLLGAIEGRNAPVVTGEDGRRALKVALAALESARTGERVEVWGGASTPALAHRTQGGG